MISISRIIFALSGLASGVFWASEQGYLSAECTTCAGGASSGVIALSGAITYLVAAFATPKRWLSQAAVLFSGAHGLFVFSQVTSGVYCGFCMAMLAVALAHAVVRLVRVREERQGWHYAFAGGAIAATIMLALIGTFAAPIEPEIIETQHFAARPSVEVKDAGGVLPSEDSAVPVFEGPVMVKAYTRSTCGFCKDFKSKVLPAILEMDDVPAFTVQYIAAEKGRSVPYFKVEGLRQQEIKGLTTAKRFAGVLRDVIKAH